jgi:hypothetical protein
VGAKARDLLTLPGFSGKILAALSSTTYLLGTGEEILWVNQEGLAAHRRCLLVSFQPGTLSPGQSFFMQGPFLRLGKGAAIDLRQATEWKPSAIRPGQAEKLAKVNASVQRLLDSVPIPGSSNGLGQALLLIGGKDPTTLSPGSWVARALRPILGLARACFDQDIARVAQTGKELVGLGPGLTPSGDDFLGGLLFVARSLKTAYPGDFPWEEGPITDLIDGARKQTHSISHSILSDLALGHGPEPLHEVVTSLLQGEDLGGVMAGVTRLLSIGHTSGWDILAGMLTGMLLVSGKLKRQPTA